MLKLSEIISLPVLSIYECYCVGFVENALFDKKTKICKFLKIYNEINDQYYLLPTKNIYSISDSILCIKNITTLIMSDNFDENKYINLITCKIFFLEDMVTLKIKDCELDNKYKPTLLIFNYDKNLSNTNKKPPLEYKLLSASNENMTILSNLDITKLILCDNYYLIYSNIKKSNNFKNNAKILKTVNSNTHVTLQQNSDNINTQNSLPKAIQNNFKSILEIEENTYHDKTLPDTLPKKSITNYGFLINRITTKNIIINSGEILIKKGEIITNKIIQKARLFGRLIELTAYSKI